MNKIITINRQFSSGGREVAKRLSDALNISYFDNEIINQVATKTDLSPEYISRVSETAALNQYTITFAHTFANIPSPIETIQAAQYEFLKELGEKQDCIIVGRCANHIFGNKAFKVFIYASDMDSRIERCYDKVPEDKDIPRKKMEKQILAIDKERAKYHRFYGSADWNDMSNYDLCINTSTIDIKKAVEIIEQSVKLYFENK